jgi:hypothetical protein
MTLLEIRTYCPEVLGKLEIFLDGGLRDGSDVLKALCLGATAVGVGRPFMYALAAYGAQGVERCVDGKSIAKSIWRFGEQSDANIVSPRGGIEHRYEVAWGDLLGPSTV